MACTKSTSASRSTMAADPGRSCAVSAAMDWTVDWNQEVECGPAAGRWMIGGRCLTSSSLSGEAKVKHPATKDVGVPPPPYVMRPDRYNASHLLTSSTER